MMHSTPSLGIGSLAKLGTFSLLAQDTAPEPPSSLDINSLQTFTQDLMSFLPTLIGAVAFLVIGLVVAAVISWVVKSLLKKTSIDERIASSVMGSSATNASVANWISTAVFWLIALFAIVGFLNALNLTVVSGPLSDLLSTVLEYLPRLLSAAILLAVAWAIATVVKAIVVQVLGGLNLDDRLAENTGVDPRQSSIRINETLGNALYWFIFLLFLPPVLDALSLNGLLQPVQGLINQFLSAIPQILTALLVFGAGWIVAKIARGLVTNLLSASGIDNLGSRFGLSSTPGAGGLSLSDLAGTIVYVFILIPFAIAALEELNIEAISAPAVSMLNQVLDFLPLLLAAGAVLTVFYFIGQFIGNLVTSLLEGFGFDSILDTLGLPEMSGSSRPATSSTTDFSTSASVGSTTIQPPTDSSRSQTPSEIAGVIVQVGVVLFGLVTATEILQLQQLTDIVTAIMGIAAQVLVGVLIFAIGLYIANLAFRLLKSSGTSNLLAQVARIFILAFVGALALTQMGIATSIVNLAFGLLLGAIAVAIAVSFGLGGREVANEQLREWVAELKRK
ncbi:MAG: mechanosensitive ion channel [Cyanobacteria bacterium P01_D01_bin.105]